MRGDEARVVDAFCSYLERDGWTVEREVSFVESRKLDGSGGTGDRLDWVASRYDPARDAASPRAEPASVEVIKGVEGGSEPALTRDPAGI